MILSKVDPTFFVAEQQLLRTQGFDKFSTFELFLFPAEWYGSGWSLRGASCMGKNLENKNPGI